MATETTTGTQTERTAEELRSLRALRRRYRGDRDLFSEAELARLRFIRWLVKSGRMSG